MKLKKNGKVVFAELPGTELHRYYLVRKKGSKPEELSGVTTMMRRLGLGKSYGDVNPDILARAAARGTAIHEMLQGYEMGEAVPRIIHYEWNCANGSHMSGVEDCGKMLDRYATEISAGNFNVIAVEYLVSDNKSVASMIDAISQVDENTVDLIDYKSSSTLDKKGLAWQLSFYKYLFERQNKDIKVRNLLGVHCHDEKKVRLVGVPYEGDAAVEDALERFRTQGADAPLPSPVPSAALSVAEVLPEYPGIMKALELRRDCQTTIERIDSEIADAMSALKDRMREGHISEVLVPGGKYIFVEEHPSTRFDTQRFKAAHPEIYDKYTTQGTTAASLKFYKAK